VRLGVALWVSPCGGQPTTPLYWPADWPDGDMGSEEERGKADRNVRDVGYISQGVDTVSYIVYLEGDSFLSTKVR
jgi:hypothetical protein